MAAKKSLGKAQNNASIHNFFKPVPKDPQGSGNAEPRSSQSLGSQPPGPQPRESQAHDSRPPNSPANVPSLPSPRASTPLARSSSSPPPHLPSSPVPEQDGKAPRRMDAVIKGSDDEDDDSFSSDEDLPDLFAKRRTDEVPAPASKGHGFNPCVTPKAKRTAISFHSSPLTIMPKHKFDMKALLSHAKSHDATEASAERMSTLISEDVGSPEAIAPGTKSGAKPGATLYETMMEVLSDAEGEEGEAERHKLLRAVKRTEALVDRKRWCFFEQAQGGSSAAPVRTPFPKAAAKAGWKCLADPKTREHVFGDGLAYTIQLRKQDLPDEIFEWILDEIPYEKSESLRQEYGRLLGACPSQVQQFFDEDFLDRLFMELGACNDALDSTARIFGKVDPNPSYPERDWSLLQSILTLLDRTSNAMTVESLTRCVSILLRLGIDSLVIENIAVRKDFSDAIESLVSAVPAKSWDSFVSPASPRVLVPPSISDSNTLFTSATTFVSRFTRP